MFEVHRKKAILVYLASGIGNLVLATPLLIALNEIGYTLDLAIHADYDQADELFSNWSVVRHIYKNRLTDFEFDVYNAVIPAIPPFYWRRFASFFARVGNAVQRPPDDLFYANEQDYYMAFARRIGYTKTHQPYYSLPIGPNNVVQVDSRNIVLSPGCKTGEMAAKRWPFYPELAEAFEDVILVGTSEDLFRFSGQPFHFPQHVCNLIDRLSLRETAELIAAAGVFIGNDSGLSHIAAAVGTPTIMIFGPTPHLSLGQFPDNVRILRACLDCEPCWFSSRFKACGERINCLHEISVPIVQKLVKDILV